MGDLERLAVADVHHADLQVFDDDLEARGWLEQEEADA